MSSPSTADLNLIHRTETQLQSSAGTSISVSVHKDKTLTSASPAKDPQTSLTNMHRQRLTPQTRYITHYNDDGKLVQPTHLTKNPIYKQGT